MAEDKKEYVWMFDLQDNPMTKDVKEDRVAKVRTLRSVNIEDIARDIVRERTEYRLDTIIGIANLIDEKIRQFVCQGNTVVTGSAQYSPSITGVFTGETGTFDAAVNALGVNIVPSKALRDEVQKVRPEFTGRVKDLGGARIGLVKDTVTGRTDGSLSPGGIVEVTGNKIRSINADGTAMGKVVLVNTETQAETDITSLAINDPSRLMFAIPASLPQGTYRLRVETYFSNASTRLKSSRVIDYEQDLYVGQAPTTPSGEQTGGDDDDSGQGTFG